MMQNQNSSMDCYRIKRLKLKDTLRMCDLSETELFLNASENERRLFVSKWLTTGHFHADIEVNERELRKGDHIFRCIRFAPWNFHHGIYLDDNTVVELTQSGVNKRTLKDFAERKPLKRRQYNGCDLSASETEKLTLEALKRPSKYCRYNVLTFNCEHFATFLKLKVQWSGEVRDVLRISDVFKNIPRTVSAVGDCINFAALTASATVVSIELFKMHLKKSLKLSEAATALAAFSVAFDITTLMFGYRLTDDACYAKMEILEDIKLSLLENARQLRFQKDLLTIRQRNAELFEQEHERLEERRIEEETIENLRCLNETVTRPSVMATISLFWSFFLFLVCDVIDFLVQSGRRCGDFLIQSARMSVKFVLRTFCTTTCISIFGLVKLYEFVKIALLFLAAIFTFTILIFGALSTMLVECVKRSVLNM